MKDGNQGTTLTDAANLAAWSTPKSSDGERGVSEVHRQRQLEKGNGASELTYEATLASWSTPSSRDWKDSPGMATSGRDPDGSERSRLDQLPRQAHLAAWPTPTAVVLGNTEESYARMKANMKSGPRKAVTELGQAAKLAGWPTPNTMAGGQTSRGGDRKDELLMGGLVSGTPATGSPAETGGRGQLNPAHSRWLMGLPPAWDDCAPTATRSSRRSPPASSRRRSKPSPEV